ncbi:N-acetylmuramoyl-L-alanine amidase [Vibrio astriarenae]
MKRITIHCTATPATMLVTADKIRQWHLARGWSDIGYHWVISRDGKVETGRSMQRTGAHVRGHNRDNIGICLVGGVSKEFEPEDNFTPEQFKALATLIHTLRHCYDIALDKVQGHHFYHPHKACPCFDVNAFLNTSPSLNND